MATSARARAGAAQGTPAADTGGSAATTAAAPPVKARLRGAIHHYAVFVALGVGIMLVLDAQTAKAAAGCIVYTIRRAAAAPACCVPAVTLRAARPKGSLHTAADCACRCPAGQHQLLEPAAHAPTRMRLRRPTALCSCLPALPPPQHVRHVWCLGAVPPSQLAAEGAGLDASHW